jgi:hypothetical protein
MERNPEIIGRSFIFASILSLIAIVGNVIGMFATGDSNVGVSAFICFLPVAFLMADTSNRRMRRHIEALEARIRQLEVCEGAA